MESLLNDNELQLIIKDLVRTSGRSFPGKEMEVNDVKRSEHDVVKSEDDAVKCAQVNGNTTKCLNC
jgi:hypothetical protein